MSYGPSLEGMWIIVALAVLGAACCTGSFAYCVYWLATHVTVTP